MGRIKEGDITGKGYLYEPDDGSKTHLRVGQKVKADPGVECEVRAWGFPGTAQQKPSRQ